jgi:hypothetical protein
MSLEWDVELAVICNYGRRAVVVTKYVCLSVCLPPGRFDIFQKDQLENILIQRFLDTLLVKLF